MSTKQNKTANLLALPNRSEATGAPKQMCLWTPKQMRAAMCNPQKCLENALIISLVYLVPHDTVMWKKCFIFE